jgi:hypothetical protein
MRRPFKPDLFEDAGMSLAVLAHGFDDGTEFVLRNGRIFPTRHLLTHSDHLATG